MKQLVDRIGDTGLISLLLTSFWAAAPAAAQNTPPSVPLHSRLAQDQIEEVVNISVGLTERTVAEIRIDYLTPANDFMVPAVHKPQKYTLSGYARQKPGKRVKVEGHGVLLSEAYLQEIVDRPTTLAGFLTSWQTVLRDVSRADPDNLPSFNIQWETPGPVTPEMLAAAEKRLGFALPGLYREALQYSGPWQIKLPQNTTFKLLPPTQAMSAAEWIGKYGDSTIWGSDEAQTRRQALGHDLVFATVNDGAVWVLRKSGKTCADGQPMLALADVKNTSFYLSTAETCNAESRLQLLRQLTINAMHDVLAAPDFTVLVSTQSLQFKRDESRSNHKKVWLFLAAGE